MDINKTLNNAKNAYFGHGMGTQISKNVEETLKHWPHLSSKITMKKIV